MIALVLVIGFAVALCVAGWVSLVRGAMAPTVSRPVDAPVRLGEDTALPEAVAV